MPRTNRRNLSALWQNAGSDDSVGSGPLSENIQGVYTLDDLSHLVVPINYAAGFAGLFNRTPVTSANGVIELNVPDTVEGAWVVSAGITHASGGTASGFAWSKAAASIITADAAALTVHAGGTLTPKSTARTGTVAHGGFPWTYPSRAEFGSADLPAPVWVNPGEIFFCRCVIQATTIYSAQLQWVEVPQRM